MASIQLMLHRFAIQAPLGMILFGCCMPLVSQAGDLQVIGFDVPAVVVAETVDPALVDMPMVGGKFIRLRVPVSTFVSTEFRGQVREYVVEIESPQQTLRMVDYWPREEVYSDIEGTIAVERSRQKDGDLAFNVSAAVEPFGRGSATGNYHDKSSTQERYQRRPPMQILTSSGTIRRGYGVFFKFKPGPFPVAEGSRDISILAEVPASWRADMLLVTMRAVGRSGTSGSDTRSLGSSKLWMTAHQEGDSAAAARARRFVSQERSLRALAASSRERIEEKSLPTIWHKMGAALDVVEPKIPDDFLTQAIFAPRGHYFEGTSHRLPVDIRIAVLDFWQQRDALLDLARGSDAGQGINDAAQHVTIRDRPDPQAGSQLNGQAF